MNTSTRNTRTGISRAAARKSTLIAVLACLLALPPAALGMDLDKQVAFHIPAQDLSSALIEFSKQTRLQVIVSDDLTGQTTQGVSGQKAIKRALSQLLEPAGLRYRVAGETSITVGKTLETAAAETDTIRAGRGDSLLRVAQSSQTNTAANGKSSDEQSSAGPTGTETLPKGANKDGSGIEEIVVTAQKREQSIQDVPISISAIGGQRIEELGLQNLNDLMGQVPGVSFTAVGPGEGNLVIRGIATTDIDGTVNNRKEAVGVYVNDTPVGLPRLNPDISPFDLERVEVLRGPQGTLYGSGSLAGTVRYITRKPNVRGFETKVGADLSSTKRGGINHRVDGMVNVPLSDTFALRVVGYELFDDGYIRGVGPAYLGHDPDDAEQYGGRVAARWTPTERFAADASVMIQRLDSDMSSQDNEGYALSRGVPVGPHEQYRDTKTFVRNRFNLYNLTLDYDLGWGHVTSSTSLLDDEVDFATDFRATIQQLYGLDLASTAFNFVSNRDLSQELRIATDFESPLSFIGGVFYTDQDRGQRLPTPTPGFDAAYTIPQLGVDSTAFGAAVDEVLTQTVAIGERQVALFGELTYEMTAKLSATAGLRWFDVEQDYFISTGGIIASGNPPLHRTSGESGFNPKFLVSYALADDVLVSAQAARGFRLGGTNEFVPQSASCAASLAALGLTKAPETFQSEHVWNYELNAKTSWLDRRLTANGSVYDIEYKDIQILTNLSCGFPFTDNAAAARSRGVELELTARPLKGLELSIGGAYTDAQLTVDVPQLGGKAGDQLPMSAKFTGNATARYEFPIGGANRGFVQYSYRHTDRILFSFDPEANPATQARPAPAYDLHNVRLGLKNDRWSASLYLNNVLDEAVISYETNFNGLERLRTRGQPRTVGLAVSANFR